MIYRFLCGNLACSSRYERQPDGSIGRRFSVEVDDIEDGEVWLCPVCRAEPS